MSEEPELIRAYAVGDVVLRVAEDTKQDENMARDHLARHLGFDRTGHNRLGHGSRLAWHKESMVIFARAKEQDESYAALLKKDAVRE